MKLRFYRCATCGKVITILTESGVPTFCCGQPMQELIPNQTDGAFEKHVPVFSRIGNTILVRVGSQPHPMTEAHSITWIGIETENGFAFQALKAGDRPEVEFPIHSAARVISVFAYCNLHGLWCSKEETKE